MRSTFLSRTSGAAVAATIGLLAISLFSGLSPQPGYAGKGNGGGGGGDTGGGSQANYDVWVVDDVLWSGGTPPADLYAPGPGCPGDTPGGAGNYAVQMLDDGDDAGNSCGIVQLFDPGAPEPNGYELRDNVGFRIVREKIQGKQYIIAVVLHGQESVGPDSFWHESEPMYLAGGPIPLPANGPAFDLHVHATVPVYRYDSHLDTNSNNPVELVGYVSVGDLEYKPQ